MTNDLAILNENLNNKVSYLAKDTQTIEEKKKLYNALEQCDHLIKDKIGETITLSNVYIESKDIVDEETGAISKKFKTILIDKKGVSYVSGSYGIYNAISRILGIYGSPDSWKEEVKVKFTEKKIDKTKTSLSLELL